jgi:predicted alpha/beta hydrolase
MSAISTELSLTPEPLQRPSEVEAVSKRLLKAAIKMAWAARGRAEDFSQDPDFSPPDRLYYRSEDGWESPLWHYPAAHGTSAEPVILAHGLATGAVGFDYEGRRSLARTLAAAGFSVYVLEHRGDRHAIPPQNPSPFDLDTIISQDLPAAISRIRAHSRHPRCLWIGHSLGGQLLVGHLGQHGSASIAAGVLICTPVRFQVPRSTARLAAMAARLLPASWSLPSQRIHQALVPLGIEGPIRELSRQLDGPIRRGVALHGTQDLPVGLIRQLATCIRSGSLVDRHDRIDYLTAMRHAQVPLMAIAARGDPTCPPESARPSIEHLPEHAREWLELDESWSSLDPLLSIEATQSVHPAILEWLERWRSSCWSE